jgi:glycerol kinase
MSIAVLDLGTTRCKTTVFDVQGIIESNYSIEYNNIHPVRNYVEQNPEVWLQSALKTIISCKIHSLKTELQGLIVTSQRATMIGIERGGSALGNSILWLDKRSLKECEQIANLIDAEEISFRTGLRIDPYFSAPKILWIKNHDPSLYDRAYKYLTVQDYIIYNLTGQMVTDQSQASRTMLFNIRKRVWDEEIFHTLHIDDAKFPKVVESGSIAGTIRNDLAENLGLPKNLPILVGGGDQQMAAIGLGCTRKGVVGISTGGGSFVISHSDMPKKVSGNRLLCSISALPNSWVLEAGIFTSGSILKWFKDQFGQKEVELAIAFNKRPYEILDRESIKRKRPSGIILLPHFAGAAAPYWNPSARGLIFNLTLETDKSDLINAILEAISIEINKNVQIIQESLKEETLEIRAGGGAVVSAVLNQIQADVCGKSLYPMIDPEVTSRGAAVLGLTKLGQYSSVDRCLAEVVRVGSEVKPNLDLIREYQKISKIGDSIYRALEENGIYREILDLD